MPDAPDLPERLSRLRELMTADGVAAAVLTPGADLRYVTGNAVHPSERLTCLLVRPQGVPVLLCPRLEVPLADAALAAGGATGGPGIDVVGWDEADDPFALAVRLLDAPGDALVALSDRAWFGLFAALRRGAPAGWQWVPAGDLVDRLRVTKSPWEIGELAAAGAAIDAVHRDMGAWLRPGRTELEVAHDLAGAIVAAGHASCDFVIVASGPNSASPHHHSADRVIERGDVVVVDIGGSLATGYRSDCTRTFALGVVPPGAQDAYDVVVAAYEHGVRAAVPGAVAGDVDRAARAVMERAGLGPAFTHRLGHGIGLDGHERPYLVEGGTEVLAPGMAFSVEPGAYLEGRYGFRLEDIVVCTPDAPRVLNHAPRELRVL